VTSKLSPNTPNNRAKYFAISSAHVSYGAHVFFNGISNRQVKQMPSDMRVPHSFSTFLTFWLSKQSSEYFKMYWVFDEVNLVKGTLTGNVAILALSFCSDGKD
jgi:hypothetical protein